MLVLLLVVLFADPNTFAIEFQKFSKPNVIVILTDDQGCKTPPIAGVTSKKRFVSAIVDEFELQRIGTIPERQKEVVRSRLAWTAQEFEAAMKSVRKYEDEIIPQVKQSLELPEKAYQAGEWDFLQVLVVRRSYYDASVSLIQLKGNLLLAESKVDGLLLTGGSNVPANFTNGNSIRFAAFGGQKP